MEQITLDILWSRLIATVNEQAAALMRSSFTSIVREAGDLSAGVFDRRGRMVAQAVTGTPGHINSMATGMSHFLTRFPLDILHPGDVLVTNDPWKTASQLNDITVATPVFHRGRVVALFANTCHALDIGGRGLSADARSVFEEGLAIPILKLHEAGRPVEPLYELIAANVRTPEEVLGDLHSQVVGNEVDANNNEVIAALWTAGHGYDLNTLVAPSSFQMLSADQINDQGTIFGQGVYTGGPNAGDPRIFILIRNPSVPLSAATPPSRPLPRNHKPDTISLARHLAHRDRTAAAIRQLSFSLSR